MNKLDKFAVFILTHGRPHKQVTLEALKKHNYTGRVYLVIDNEDSSADEYKQLYGDQVIQFDKLAISETFDTADLSDNRKAIVYARNACFEIAKELGLEYFVQFDDDYNAFGIRYAEGKRLIQVDVKDLDRAFGLMLDFLDDTGVLTVCFSQGGDHMGGVQGRWKDGLLRKAMNSFFCKVDNPFQFVGRVNEDVNTYTTLGSRGELLVTVTDFILIQNQTQGTAGGMTDLYLDGGTYLKSFYSVMMVPSAVEIREMGTSHKRLHHHVKWNNCVPMIINERYKR